MREGLGEAGEWTLLVRSVEKSRRETPASPAGSQKPRGLGACTSRSFRLVLGRDYTVTVQGHLGPRCKLPLLAQRDGERRIVLT